MFRLPWRLMTALALTVSGGASLLFSAESADPTALGRAETMYQDGNYAEALDEFRRLTTGPDGGLSSNEVAEAFRHAVDCFTQLGDVDQLDAYRQEIAQVHVDDWRVLLAVGASYESGVHYGFQIAGEFRRGQHRGGGKVMNAAARDRVQALRLYLQALELFQQRDRDANGGDQANPADGRQIFDRIASGLMMDAGGAGSWRLQTLTDLDELPDYEEGWGYGGAPQGAPVDANGDPVVYEKPASWNEARSDGERWRWALAERTATYPELGERELLDRAAFLQSQFGVETLAYFGRPRARDGDDNETQKTGTFALHTLDEDETIARLATGVKRFELPAGDNHIELLKRVAEQAEAESAEWREANERLATLFENRRQFPRAAEFWRTVVDGPQGAHKEAAQLRLEQIVGNWGRLEPAQMQAAGGGASLDYRYRNGRRVEFIAQSIDVRRLLADVKKYLSSDPRELSWEQLNIDNLGYRLVRQGQEQYLGAETARWSLDLDPRPNHFDRRVTVPTPLNKPGAYFVTAKMTDGNEHSVVLWVADTAIVKKPQEDSALYYVADSFDGKPVAKAHVEYFGWRQEQEPGGRYRIVTKNVADFTDASGLVKLPNQEPNQRMQWLAIATTPGGRLAHLGFNTVWTGQYRRQEYNQVKAYALTDRPVYRPGDEVQFKFWIRTARYDATAETDAEFAAKSFVVEIRDPRNEKVFSQSFTSDKYGGIAGKWTAPEGALLGEYQLFVVNHGGGAFRVEEYKKPEFEVTIDAPDEPLMLGEQAAATISAKYYFGSPVVNARVRYKVLRSAYDHVWWPPMPWDWLYGPGYWWFAESYEWYPGWERWGCAKPWPWWWWRQPAPPEVIAEQEVEIGPDGTVEIKIDTTAAKELHGDQDHRYEIQAEVTDESRRTITAVGEVLAPRQPFRVFMWTHRGYYHVGDPIHVEMAARTIDGEGVKGSGTLRLRSIEYVDGKPVETEVAKWDLPTGDDGRADLQIKASEPGQYRLSYELVDDAGHRVEGGQIITVRGEGFDGSDFRFNDLEIVPDCREYAPGETVKLQVNVDRRDATVLLFLRPVGGVYLPPQIVRVPGKSTVVEIPVEQGDMPNFFVEAVAVHSGEAYTVLREIFVPPTKRVVDVAVTPSSDKYLPGEEAKVQVKVTDPDGAPAVGSLVVAVYDKALDYIAGGAAPPDIREFFWKWRREHRPQSETNLDRWQYPVSQDDERQMADIGLFGATSVDELDASADKGVEKQRLSMGGQSGFGGGAAFDRSMSMAVPMSAAAEAPASGRFAARPEEAAETRGATEVAPQIRKDFADTALWVGSLETDANGLAEVTLKMPENLTTWKIGAWSMGAGTRVGEGSAEAVTRKNIIVRLQAPRFFVERDEVVLSANVHNYLDHAKIVRVKLDLQGGALVGPDSMEESIEIPAGGEQRIDWRVKAAHEGTAVVRASALTDEESDAIQMSFPVLVHGMLKQESYSGVLRPDEGGGQFTVTVPRERRAEQTRLEVRYTPTLAGAMLDALPYLIDYPYGCTEQTLNRFLPAVITQHTLQQMGVDLAAIKEKRTNLNAQEIADPDKRAAQWKRYDENPVFDGERLAEIVAAGVNRLTEMQLPDGGWGWFSGWGEHSGAHTTAQVVRGLLVARENEAAVVPGVLERGVDWLDRYEHRQLALLDAYNRQADKRRGAKIDYKRYADNVDAYVHMVLVKAGRGSARMRNYLYADRTQLAPYAVGLFGLALQEQLTPEDRSAVGGVGNDAQLATETDQTQPPQESQPRNDFEEIPLDDMLAMVLRNLSQYVEQDDENQTAWLDLPDGTWWYWYGSEYEAHAAYLKLLAATEPQSEVASRMVKYLLNNRKHATYWNSTRDTALVVEAFADYLQATGEAKPNLQIEVWIDGERQKSVAVSAENLFSFDGTLVIEGADLAPGKHVVELRKTGEGPLYYNGYLTNFTLEDPIAAAGLELKIDRKFYRLVREETEAAVAGERGQAMGQRTEKYRRESIVNLAQVASGELAEVELVVDSKNDYEYVMLEDRKAAGFEPVEVRSGYNGNDMGAYVEYRDQKVALFVQRLARGKHSVSYRLRAEIPGKFSALPATAAAMYAPELKANSDEMKVRVVDREE